MTITRPSAISRRALAAVAIVTVFVLSACSSGSSAISNVDAASFLTTAAQPGVTVVDVRTPEEYAAGHLQGAVNMNVEGPDFSTEIATLSKGNTVAVYCHSGRRSAMAADELAGSGFTSIVNLKGGIADLEAAGGAIVN